MSYHESQCFKCDAMCCLTERQYRHAKETGADFYCSRGHSQHFVETENSELTKRIEQLERCIEDYKRVLYRRDAEIRSLRASRAARVGVERRKARRALEVRNAQACRPGVRDVSVLGLHSP